MQWTQIHLALNHVPVVGGPFLLLLLAWGLFRQSAEILRLAHAWILVFALISIGLKFTGDFAADSQKERLVPLRVWVERHEQSADQATTGLFLMGLSSAVALVAGRRRANPPAGSTWITLGIGVLTCVLVGRAAHFGGQISHPELRGPVGNVQIDLNRLPFASVVA